MINSVWYQMILFYLQADFLCGLYIYMQDTKLLTFISIFSSRRRVRNGMSYIFQFRIDIKLF